MVCPDCLENYITEEQKIIYGICDRCRRRKVSLTSRGKEYIKYKDLTREEKLRLNNMLLSQRRKYERRKKAKGKLVNREPKNTGSTGMKPSTYIVDLFLKSDKLKSIDGNYVSRAMLYSLFIEFCKETKCSLITSDEFLRVISNKYGHILKEVDGTSYTLINDDKTSRQKRGTGGRPSKIYTPDVIEFIKGYMNDKITVSTLLQTLKDRFPDKSFGTSIYAQLERYGIPYFQVGSGFSKKECKVEPDATEKDIQSTFSAYVPVVDDEPEKSNISEIDAESSTSNCIQTNAEVGATQKLVDKKSRLEPIHQEVVSTLDERFKNAKCVSQYNYSIDDYINMFEALSFLSSNIDGLIRCRNEQHKITNLYQDDVIHAMENELAEDGNTYLQDKVFVLRDYRRYMQLDIKALYILKPVLKHLKTIIHPNNPNNPDDLQSLVGVIKALKETRSQFASPTYRPRIDKIMTEKYDWAELKNSDVKEKHKGEKPSTLDVGIDADSKTKKVSDEFEKGLCTVYRVSCQISGAGYGAFRPWYKDYTCANEDIAKAYAEQEFARMRANKKSIMITNLKITRLNV